MSAELRPEPQTYVSPALWSSCVGSDCLTTCSLGHLNFNGLHCGLSALGDGKRRESGVGGGGGGGGGGWRVRPQTRRQVVNEGDYRNSLNTREQVFPSLFPFLSEL